MAQRQRARLITVRSQDQNLLRVFFFRLAIQTVFCRNKIDAFWAENVITIRHVQVAIYELKMWTMWQGWKDEEQRRIRVEREYANLESVFIRVKNERDELRTERDELREEVNRLKAICSAMNAGQ